MLDWKERLEDLSMKVCSHVNNNLVMIDFFKCASPPVCPLNKIQVDKLEKENETLKKGGVVPKAIPTVATVPSIPPPPPLPGKHATATYCYTLLP